MRRFSVSAQAVEGEGQALVVVKRRERSGEDLNDNFQQEAA
jgi:hypothetical protein